MGNVCNICKNMKCDDLLKFMSDNVHAPIKDGNNAIGDTVDNLNLKQLDFDVISDSLSDINDEEIAAILE